MLTAKYSNLNRSKQEQQGCCKTTKQHQKKPFFYHWLPAVVVAILPKCPFCIMAYSGAITMCSGKSISPHAGSIFSYVTLALALVVLLGILLNYRGTRTWIAAIVTGLGILCMLISQFILFSSSLYFLGSALLFFGIWYNGSFYYFLRRYLSRFFGRGSLQAEET